MNARSLGFAALGLAIAFGLGMLLMPNPSKLARSDQATSPSSDITDATSQATGTILLTAQQAVEVCASASGTYSGCDTGLPQGVTMAPIEGGYQLTTLDNTSGRMLLLANINGTVCRAFADQPTQCSAW